MQCTNAMHQCNAPTQCTSAMQQVTIATVRVYLLLDCRVSAPFARVTLILLYRIKRLEFFAAAYS